MDDKKIKELQQQIDGYLSAQNWDGAIEAAGQLLKLAPKNPEAYNARGLAYRRKGKYRRRAIADFTNDLAIADFTKAIEYKPDFAEAYYNLGNAYVQKEDYDLAIANYKKAIKYKLGYAGAYYGLGLAYYVQKEDYDLAIANFKKAIKYKLGYAEAYYGLGRAYAMKGEHDDLAIANFKEAIKYKPDYAEAYYELGLAYYGRKEDYDLAIVNFTKTIEYNPNDADAYFHRGIFYAMQGNYDCAVKDLANSYELGMKNVVLVYIAYKIKKINHENPGALFKSFMLVWLSVMKITEELQLSPDSNSFPVVHYCSLRTLKSMIRGNGFRFYNATHMDDPKEGEAFFNMMDDEGIKDYFYKGNSSKHKYPSSCYIGSFVANENKDEHIFWQIYGKDKDIGAAGCNLIFEQKRFSSKLEVKTAGMISNEEEVKTAGMISNEEKLPILYRVCYEGDKDIKGLLDKLKDELKELKKEIEKNKNPKHKEELKSLACALIDSVRYYFKSSHYASEKEVRIIEFRAPEGDIETDDSGAGSPKFYIDPYEKFIFDEVTLGPKINDVEAWRFWLDKKLPKVKIEKSKIPCR